MNNIDCPYCDQPTLLYWRTEDKVSLCSEWKAFEVLGSLCPCEGAERLRMIYVLEREDSIPDMVFVEKEAEIEASFGYLMKVDG